MSDMGDDDIVEMCRTLANLYDEAGFKPASRSNLRAAADEIEALRAVVRAYDKAYEEADSYYSVDREFDIDDLLTDEQWAVVRRALSGGP